MNQEKNKKLAPQVVLAQHGNKEAMRYIYIQYYKNIFFICKILIGDTSQAMKLTAEIFTKMFSSVDKLSDHMAFEQWFYSLSINLCKSHMHADTEIDTIVTDNMKNIAETASRAAKAKDKYTFEHSVMKLLEEMINTLPNEAKIIFFYSSLASLDAERIAVLEKEETENIENSINAVNIIFEKQTQKLKELGVDVSPFIRDSQTTFSHLAAKTFVPDGVHEAVSANIGINVDPFANKPSAETVKKEEKEAVKAKETKRVKKNLFSKGDLILFFAVLVVAVLIFSGVKIYRNAVSDEQSKENQAAETVIKPVLTWNGAAASSFDSGNGTEEEPYIISNGGQLAYLANLINSGNSYYSGCYYQLDCDIVLNDTSDYDSWFQNAPENKWTPIGNENGLYFSGTFDGNGHSVSGMYVSGDHTYYGLFGAVKNGCIKNLTVKEAYVNGKSLCGGIAGYFYADVNLGADIENCSFSGNVSSSADNAGGIVGLIEAVGDKNFVSVSSNCVSGSVVSEGSNAGGIAGLVYANSGDVKISDCFSTSEIRAEGENVGGIAGCVKVADGDGSVYNCYNAGAVSGIKGESTGSVAGILECENGSGVITVMYCTALEDTAPTLTGAASADSMVVKSVRSATSEEMQTEDAFEMFDFDSVWTFDDNGYLYPVLRDTEFIKFSVREKYTVQ